MVHIGFTTVLIEKLSVGTVCLFNLLEYWLPDSINTNGTNGRMTRISMANSYLQNHFWSNDLSNRPLPKMFFDLLFVAFVHSCNS